MAQDRKSAAPRLTMEHLDDIEEQIEMLKVAYERYFNGVDRIPPRRTHDSVKLHVRNLVRMHTGSTAVRFRAQGLKARLVTYEHYWTRVLGQIERGTFKRVLAESKRREFEIWQKRRLAEQAPSEEPDHGREADAPVARPAARSGSAANRVALPDGMNAGEARDLFKQFVAAKKAAGEPLDGLTYGRLVEKLAKEVPKLQEKHGASVRFEVSTEGGRVRLRARRRSTQPSA